MNNKSQKLLFIVLNFLMIMFLFKKCENKSDLKELTIYLFLRCNLSNKLLGFKEDHLAIFLK